MKCWLASLAALMAVLAFLHCKPSQSGVSEALDQQQVEQSPQVLVQNPVVETEPMKDCFCSINSYRAEPDPLAGCFITCYDQPVLSKTPEGATTVLCHKFKRRFPKRLSCGTSDLAPKFKEFPPVIYCVKNGFMFGMFGKSVTAIPTASIGATNSVHLLTECSATDYGQTTF